MLDREIMFTGKYPNNSAHEPASGKARVKRQGTVDQPDHGTDILAELSENKSCIGEDARVVLCRLERLPNKIDGLAAVCLRRCGPTVTNEPQMADRRPGKGGPVMPIDHDRLFEQPQSLHNPFFRHRKEGCKPA